MEYLIYGLLPEGTLNAGEMEYTGLRISNYARACEVAEDACLIEGWEGATFTLVSSLTHETVAVRTLRGSNVYTK